MISAMDKVKQRKETLSKGKVNFFRAVRKVLTEKVTCEERP